MWGLVACIALYGRGVALMIAVVVVVIIVLTTNVVICAVAIFIKSILWTKESKARTRGVTTNQRLLKCTAAISKNNIVCTMISSGWREEGGVELTAADRLAVWRLRSGVNA